ncbi:MAG: hypothetical protein HC769_02255 [Cyanobacteria bacterium CRU_2_1]|nr:hypothetical protein [Cyanobacteria bacterium RU_5_0]NJR57776.1 hypothetical protein [Cyanobacteria bacterium CRU_2_1]
MDWQFALKIRSRFGIFYSPLRVKQLVLMREDNDTIKLKFPLWQYLNQPLFSPQFKSLNPFRFWHLHNIERLKATWMKSHADLEELDTLIQFLENCWMHPCWRRDLRRDSELIEWLERCWIRSLGKSKGFFDESEERY